MGNRELPRGVVEDSESDMRVSHSIPFWSLVIYAVVQLGLTVWWASNINTQVSYLTNQVAALVAPVNSISYLSSQQTAIESDMRELRSRVEKLEVDEASYRGQQHGRN